MNRKSRIAFGPGAASMILIVVVLSMSILGILALLSARSDVRLSHRAVEVTRAVYALQNASERHLAELSGLAADIAKNPGEGPEGQWEKRLPDGMTMDGDTISWEETDGVRTLFCAVRVEDQGIRMITRRLTASTEETWN